MNFMTIEDPGKRMPIALGMQLTERSYRRPPSQKVYAWTKSNRRRTRDRYAPRVGVHLNGRHEMIQ